MLFLLNGDVTFLHHFLHDVFLNLVYLYITYLNRTQVSIGNTLYHKLLNVPKMDGEYIYGKNDLFALIIILKDLLTEKDFKMMMNEINYEIDWLASKLKCINVIYNSTTLIHFSISLT